MRRCSKSSYTAATAALLLLGCCCAVVDAQTSPSTPFTMERFISFLLALPRLLFAFLWPGCWQNFYQETEYGANFIRNEDYVRFGFQAADAITEMRIQQQGAITLQGLFWMDISTDKQAELFSFAATPEGGSVSTGVITETETYNVRGPGDRVRAQTFNMTSNTYGDSIFEFHLEEGTSDDPVLFRIVSTLLFPGTCTRYRADVCYEGLMDFFMKIENTPDTVDDGRPAHPKYSNSVVWNRNSEGLLLYDYQVIQIVDGNQNKLQPAYDDFVARVAIANDGVIYANTIGPTVQPPRCPR